MCYTITDEVVISLIIKGIKLVPWDPVVVTSTATSTATSACSSTLSTTSTGGWISSCMVITSPTGSPRTCTVTSSLTLLELGLEGFPVVLVLCRLPVGMIDGLAKRTDNFNIVFICCRSGRCGAKMTGDGISLHLVIHDVLI